MKSRSVARLRSFLMASCAVLATAVHAADTTPPTLVSALIDCTATTKIVLTFSEDVTSASATVAGNYAVAGNTVTSAALTTSTSVTLTVGTDTVGKPSTVTINNVRDLAGNAVATNTSSLAIAATSELGPGTVRTAFNQNNTPGAYFTGTMQSKLLDSGPINYNWGTTTPFVGSGNNVTVRWVGYVLPTATGNYTFRTVSDDGSKLYINGNVVVDTWATTGLSTGTSGTVSLTANVPYPLILEWQEKTGSAQVALQWTTPSNASYAVIPISALKHCAATQIASINATFTTTNFSICSTTDITVRLLDALGRGMRRYLGNVELYAPDSGTGAFTLLTGGGTSNTSQAGTAFYTMVAADDGTFSYRYRPARAFNNAAFVVTLPDASYTKITFVTIKDNTFVIAEDSANKVAGTGVGIAGRSHDFKITNYRRDAVTGICAVDNEYVGSKGLRLWRTDVGGTWTAPATVTPALTLPASEPASNNFTITFTAGVASFNLLAPDVGKYDINVKDQSVVTNNGFAITGNIAGFTVRPFALVLSALTQGSTANPSGSSATDSVFGKAGRSFSATLGAYKYSATADTNTDGVPDASATLAQTTAGGLTAGFNSPVTVSPLSASQTPAGGALGTLSGSTFSSYASTGRQTLSTLAYSEVGSFRISTANAITDYLGTVGLNLPLTVFNATAQNDRVGRFTPDRLNMSASPACGTGTPFVYSGQPLPISVTAVNAAGSTTSNYSSALGFSKAVTLTAAGSPGAGAWSSASVPASAFAAGVASVQPAYTYTSKLTSPSSLVARGTDADGVTSNGGTEPTVPVRSGRLSLESGVSSETAALDLILSADYWTGSAWVRSTDDNCTVVPASAIASSNKSNAAATYAVSSIPLTSGVGAVRLTPSTSGADAAGSLDVAIALGVGGVDASCLASHGGIGAGLPWMRSRFGACNATYTQDPAARATFGVYRPETAKQMHLRELR